MDHRIILFIALVSIPRLAQDAPFQAKEEQAAIIEFAQKAVVRALDYSQGDRQSLIDAQDDFTADSWREFMKRMDGWLDSNGAPLGSSSFVPSGDALITDQTNGLMHLTVPGALKQTQNKSVTTYQVVIDVRVGGNPAKIANLQPIVRVRPRAAAQSGPPALPKNGSTRE